MQTRSVVCGLGNTSSIDVGLVCLSPFFFPNLLERTLLRLADRQVKCDRKEDADQMERCVPCASGKLFARGPNPRACR